MELQPHFSATVNTPGLERKNILQCVTYESICALTCTSHCDTKGKENTILSLMSTVEHKPIQEITDVVKVRTCVKWNDLHLIFKTQHQ